MKVHGKSVTIKTNKQESTIILPGNDKEIESFLKIEGFNKDEYSINN
jgi:hypothetical protein